MTPSETASQFAAAQYEGTEQWVAAIAGVALSIIERVVEELVGHDAPTRDVVRTQWYRGRQDWCDFVTYAGLPHKAQRVIDRVAHAVRPELVELLLECGVDVRQGM